MTMQLVYNMKSHEFMNTGNTDDRIQKYVLMKLLRNAAPAALGGAGSTGTASGSGLYSSGSLWSTAIL